MEPWDGERCVELSTKNKKRHCTTTDRTSRLAAFPDSPFIAVFGLKRPIPPILPCTWMATPGISAQTLDTCCPMPPGASNFFKNSLELHRFLASRALCTIAVLQEVIQIFSLKKLESCRTVFDVLLSAAVTDELATADSVIETFG